MFDQEPMTRSLQLPYWAYIGNGIFADRSIFRLSFPENKNKGISGSVTLWRQLNFL